MGFRFFIMESMDVAMGLGLLLLLLWGLGLLLWGLRFRV